MNLYQLLDEGKQKLIQVGIEDALLDARLLLLAAFELDMAHYLSVRMKPFGELSEDGDEDGCVTAAVAAYRRMIDERCRRIPLQQILGCQEFMGLQFYVNEHVLIPRQDTETLVELVLSEHPKQDARVLDLGTGSGCIAISLAVKGGYCLVTAVDISADALMVARRNAAALVKDWEQRISFVQGDLFAALDGASQLCAFDLIVSNPPYIPTGVIETLQPEVKDHEPVLALDGSEDGLHFYRRIAAKARAYGKSGGSLYLEIGFDQGEAVSGLLRCQGYQEIAVVKDLAGNDRVVRACFP